MQLIGGCLGDVEIGSLAPRISLVSGGEVVNYFAKENFKYLALIAFVVSVFCYSSSERNPLLPWGLAPETTAVQRYTDVVASAFRGVSPGLATAQAASQPAGAENKGKGKSPNFFVMGMAGLAGLVLFIFGLTQLAQGLEESNTERMRELLSKFTTNRFAGVGTGIVATTTYHCRILHCSQRPLASIRV